MPYRAKTAVCRSAGQVWARIACSTPLNGVLSLVDGDAVPTNAATRSIGYDSEVAKTAPATVISPAESTSDDRRPTRSASSPMRTLATTEPVAATASRRPMRAGGSPSSVNICASKTLA
jgi:hypothetical protein